MKGLSLCVVHSFAAIWLELPSCKRGDSIRLTWPLVSLPNLHTERGWLSGSRKCPSYYRQASSRHTLSIWETVFSFFVLSFFFLLLVTALFFLLVWRQVASPCQKGPPWVAFIATCFQHVSFYIHCFQRGLGLGNDKGGRGEEVISKLPNRNKSRKKQPPLLARCWALCAHGPGPYDHCKCHFL